MKKIVVYAFVFFLIGSIVIQTSCTKQHLSEDQLVVSPQDQLLEKTTLAFLEEYKLYKEGKILKSGEEVPVSEAIDYIDETFNFTYSFPLTPYKRFHTDEAYLEIPITNNGKVYKYCDLFATYDQVVETVRSIYNSYLEQNKRVIGLQIEDFGNNPQTGDKIIRIVSQIITGTGVSITPEDDFFYARDHYRCDGNLDYGAANIVEWETNFALTPVPPPNYRIYYTGVITWYPDPLAFPAGNTIDNFEDYFIYYGSAATPNWDPTPGGTKCIEDFGVTGSEMSFYIESMNYEVIDYYLNNLNQDQRVFKTIKVSSFNDYIPYEIDYHSPEIYFGFRHISNATPYPMAID